MLPNESLLVMLQFADYKTLVATKLAERRFLRLVVKYAAELACRRSFQVDFTDTWISCDDLTAGERRSIRYEPLSKKSLEATCREVAEAIGPHSLTSLTFFEHAWNMHGVGVIFEAAATLKYADEVAVYGSGGATVWSHFETLMSNFVALKSLSLRLNGDVFHHFSWEFLRQETARQLRRISVDDLLSGHAPASENMKHAVEQLVHNCATLPRLLNEGSLELDFTQIGFPGAFGLRIIELLKNCGRKVAFRMLSSWNVENLLLDGNAYTIDADDTTTRYAFDKSGIVVEVLGSWINIRSTADASRKKPQLGTKEDFCR